MKKIKKMLIISIMLIMMFLTVKVNAVSNVIAITGNEKTKEGEIATITVTLLSDDFRGLEGKIETSSNITIENVKSVNNAWQVSYNKENGQFAIYQGNGNSLMEITYKGTKGSGNIKLTDMKMSNTEYETLEVSDVSKTITLEEETPIPNDPQNQEPQNQEQEDNKDNGNTNQGSLQGREDPTTANKILAKTGLKSGIIIIAIVALVISIYMYYKYKKYKKI